MLNFFFANYFLHIFWKDYFKLGVWLINGAMLTMPKKWQ